MAFRGTLLCNLTAAKYTAKYHQRYLRLTISASHSTAYTYKRDVPRRRKGESRWTFVRMPNHQHFEVEIRQFLNTLQCIDNCLAYSVHYNLCASEIGRT